MRAVLRTVLVTIGLFSVAGPDANAEKSDGWVVENVKQTIRYWRGDEFEKGDFDGIFLRTSSPSEPPTLLSCMSGFGLSAKIYLKPTDTTKLDVVVLDMRKGREAELRINGETAKRSVWAFNADRNEAVSYDPYVVALIYDAAMTGKSAQLKLPSRKLIQISLPQADESFERFVAECPFLGAPD